MTNWICTDDQLPPDGSEGLCCIRIFGRSDSKAVVLPFRMVDGEWRTHFIDSDSASFIGMCHAIHTPFYWMPFPQLPEDMQ